MTDSNDNDDLYYDRKPRWVKDLEHPMPTKAIYLTPQAIDNLKYILANVTAYESLTLSEAVVKLVDEYVHLSNYKLAREREDEEQTNKVVNDKLNLNWCGSLRIHDAHSDPKCDGVIDDDRDEESQVYEEPITTSMFGESKYPALSCFHTHNFATSERYGGWCGKVEGHPSHTWSHKYEENGFFTHFCEGFIPMVTHEGMKNNVIKTNKPTQSFDLSDCATLDGTSNPEALDRIDNLLHSAHRPLGFQLPHAQDDK